MKKVTRSPQEITRQIDGLLAERERLPAVSALGSDNYGKIDAQIEVLKGEAIPDEFYQDELDEDYEEADNDVWRSAVEAMDWMEGKNDRDLFD